MRQKLRRIQNHIDKHLFRIYQKIGKRQKISNRIVVSFFSIAFCCLALFIINFFTVHTISSSQERLLRIKDYQQELMDFTHTVTVAEIQTNQLKRLLNETHQPLKDTDQQSIHNTVTVLQSSLVEIIPAIQELSPQSDLEEFKTASNRVIQAYNAWEEKKELVLLDQALFSLKNIQFLSDTMLSTLTQRINNQMVFIQNQMNLIIIVDIVVGLIILGIITVLIFPLLKEFQWLLNPLRKASEIALEGAVNVSNHSTDVDISFQQFKAVLNIMSQSVAEVYQGAQYNSLQAKTIIISVKTASDLVADLAQKATDIFVTLSNHQNNLTEKIQRIHLLSETIERSLGIISHNITLAEQLTQRVSTLPYLQTAESPSKYNSQDETIAEISGHMIHDLTAATFEFQTIKQEFAELKDLLESLYSSNQETISASEIQLRSTEQIQLKTQQIMDSVENIIGQTEEVSASMQQLAASSEEINSQMEYINTKVSETHQVVEKQLDLAKLAKEATDRF